MSDIERRFVSLETQITGKKLQGYGAVFNQRTDIGGYYFEELAPTAFRSVLSSDPDVMGLFNHDPNMPLARTRNGSLKLSTDSHGLEFEMELNLDTTLAKDVRENVNSGLLTGCSFGFIAGPVPDGQHWDVHEGRDLRVHTSVAELLDVSVVTYPAYKGTSVALRSKPTTPAESRDGRTSLIRAEIAHYLKRGK